MMMVVVVLAVDWRVVVVVEWVVGLIVERELSGYTTAYLEAEV